MRKISCVLVLVMIFLSGVNACTAENLKFVDSKFYNGYFVDTDSVNFESDWVFSVNMVIINADLKQMEVVNLEINYQDKNYVARSSKIYSYDKREELYVDDNPRPVQNYGDDSLIGEAVKIILYESE